MTVANLTDVLTPALMRAMVGWACRSWVGRCLCLCAAAEELRCPAHAGRPGCRTHTPVSVWGQCFVAWLSRRRCLWSVISIMPPQLQECQAGIDHGFTSVMIDGSRLRAGGECRADELRFERHCSPAWGVR